MIEIASKIEYVRCTLADVPLHSRFFLPTEFVECVRESQPMSSHYIQCSLGNNLNVKFLMIDKAFVYVRQTDFYHQIEIPF